VAIKEQFRPIQQRSETDHSHWIRSKVEACNCPILVRGNSWDQPHRLSVGQTLQLVRSESRGSSWWIGKKIIMCERRTIALGLNFRPSHYG
jgi:hypothetical protein